MMRWGSTTLVLVCLAAAVCAACARGLQQQEDPEFIRLKGPPTTIKQLAFAGFLKIPGNSVDKSKETGPNGNRFGGFSDTFYDRKTDTYYTMPDRGPGGGTIAYKTRVHKLKIKNDIKTGAVTGYTLQDTILLTVLAASSVNGKPGPANLNGLNPQLLSGSVSDLGLSFDPEGLAVDYDGNFFISDEYGPSLYKFNKKGELLRTFTVPTNLVPKEANGAVNYVGGRADVKTGRQDNRGYEGLAMSPDGKTLYAVLQDALFQEGAQSDGRRSRNLRIIAYDVDTFQSKAQYIYQLETLAEINARVPTVPFSATAQGRNIGVSSLYMLNADEILVLERDNRGIGVDNMIEADPTTSANLLSQVGSKRVYKISLKGATDVSAVSLAGTSDLPASVVPVSKTLVANLTSIIRGGGAPVGEKMESLTFGPRLLDGSYFAVVLTDNDFSVTQNDATVQFDVCAVWGTTKNDQQVAFGSPCPAGKELLPSYIYSFKATV